MLSNATRCHWWPVDDEVQVGNRNRKWNGNGNENGTSRNRSRNESQPTSLLSTVRLWQPLYGLPSPLLPPMPRSVPASPLWISLCVCVWVAIVTSTLKSSGSHVVDCCGRHLPLAWHLRAATHPHLSFNPFPYSLLSSWPVQLEELFTFDLAHWLAPSAKFAFRLCTARLAQRPLLITNLQLAACNRKLATSKLARSSDTMCQHSMLGLICCPQVAAFSCRFRSKFKVLRVASCWQLPLQATFASITLHFYCREKAPASSPDCRTIRRCWQRPKWPGWGGQAGWGRETGNKRVHACIAALINRLAGKAATQHGPLSHHHPSPDHSWRC